MKDTNQSGSFSAPGTRARAEAGVARVCKRIRARLCAQSVAICANQLKTNVLLHSSFGFKILLLVPLV